MGDRNWRGISVAQGETLTPASPIPADANQSSEIQRQREAQQKLPAEKDVNRQLAAQR
jgi:hypothetical protein